MLEYERFIGSIRRECLNHLALEKQCPIGSEREVETGRIIGDNPFANRGAKTNAELGRFRIPKSAQADPRWRLLEILSAAEPDVGTALRGARPASVRTGQILLFVRP